MPEKEDKKRWRIEEFRHLRAHTLDVLLQLSAQGFDRYRENPLAQSSVRAPLGKLPTNRPDLDRQASIMSVFHNSEVGSLADEGTSNLFYYLFEDYVAAGPLKAAEEELEEMVS